MNRLLRRFGWVLVSVEEADRHLDAARFLPTVNGAVEPTVEGALQEAVMLADACVAVGRLITPERWYKA